MQEIIDAMQRSMNHAMLVAMIGEDAVNAIPDNAIIGLRFGQAPGADGRPVFSISVLTPPDEASDESSPEAAAEEVD